MYIDEHDYDSESWNVPAQAVKFSKYPTNLLHFAPRGLDYKPKNFLNSNRD